MGHCIVDRVAHVALGILGTLHRTDGQSAMRYVTAIRMQRAITLLRDERSTVAAVATASGYASEAAFAAAFKRVTVKRPAHTLVQ